MKKDSINFENVLDYNITKEPNGRINFAVIFQSFWNYS